MRVVILAVVSLAALQVACAHQSDTSTRTSWDVEPEAAKPMFEAADAGGNASAEGSRSRPTAELPRRRTIVLGSGDSAAYDAMMADRVQASPPSGNTIVIQQQQTMNNYGGGFGYYGYRPVVPYYNPDSFVRPSVAPAARAPTLAPGQNWPTLPSYGPRMLGDRSR